jgi:hypothetical protein
VRYSEMTGNSPTENSRIRRSVAEVIIGRSP